jgi:hypothetical protein
VPAVANVVGDRPKLCLGVEQLTSRERLAQSLSADLGKQVDLLHVLDAALNVAAKAVPNLLNLGDVSVDAIVNELYPLASDQPRGPNRPIGQCPNPLVRRLQLGSDPIQFLDIQCDCEGFWHACRTIRPNSVSLLQILHG